MKRAKCLRAWAEVWLALAALGAGSSAFAAHPSDARRPEQSYLSAFAETRGEASEPHTDGDTPWSLQRPIDQLDIRRAPVVASLAELQRMFERVRDVRAWSWSGKPEFARRIPWLYLFDGCYLRAELVAEKFREWGYPQPRQVLAFGNLTGASPFGTATWWYHVAPVFRVERRAYVLDASLDAAHPLPLEAWVLKMVRDRNSAQLSICNTEVTDPEGDCYASESGWDQQYKVGQIDYYLGEEWKLLQSALGKEPTDLLGELPPWSSPN